MWRHVAQQGNPGGQEAKYFVTLGKLQFAMSKTTEPEAIKRTFKTLDISDSGKVSTLDDTKT